LVNTFHEGPRCLALPLTRGIILLFVLPFTGVKRRLDDRKQDVDERILEAVKLMRNETDQVEMAILIDSTNDLKDLGFEHGVGIVAESVRGQVQGCNNRTELGVEELECVPVVERRSDLRRFCRLGNGLQECQLETLDVRWRLSALRRLGQEALEQRTALRRDLGVNRLSQRAFVPSNLPDNELS
jgi:hypothetical protein